jgi:hypothetical protein
MKMNTVNEDYQAGKKMWKAARIRTSAFQQQQKKIRSPKGSLGLMKLQISLQVTL